MCQQYFVLLSDNNDFNKLSEEYPSQEEKETLVSFKTFLLDNELVFYCPEELVHNFIDFGYAFNPPGIITNAIADYESNSPYKLEDFIKASNSFGAKHFQIRSYFSNFDEEELNAIFLIFENSGIKSFEIIAKYNERISQFAKSEIEFQPRCKSIVLHSAPITEYIPSKQNTAMGIYASTVQKISGPEDCSNNSMQYMNVNAELFLEAKQFHTYYYKKVSIDNKGLLKNCTSHLRDFGKFSNVDFLTIISSQEFQAVWFAKKDETEICKDCEFRYMCIDSREIFPRSADLWFHKEQCNYNPYNGRWSNE
ncbi:hypothetical protein BH11BAC7_BH11BAC7_15790 [soil metagenome]